MRARRDARVPLPLFFAKSRIEHNGFVVVNASEIDSTVFVWLLLVIPAIACVLGIAAGLFAGRRRWPHPVLLGLGTVVAAMLAGWLSAAAFDALNG